ncbi:hypothetical protein [Sphingomonas sp. PAMC 26617]|uniref:hypothetical protein n=1 Tax=Sphingomonas sp. PAMC 26617 TaxID=1112216 RepID=UPI0002D287D9|nr:hypothetical protein [Sphingomonas sp. PAMC 26617]
MLAMLLAAAAAATTPTVLPSRGIDAPYPNVAEGIVYVPTPTSISADITHHNRMVALRTEALDLQARDGGMLTAEHKALLQHKLDRIQFRFAEMRRRADIFSVDATGQAMYTAYTRPKVVYPPNTGRTGVAN